MDFTFIPTAGEAVLPSLAAAGRPLATLAYSLDRPFPAPRRSLRGGCMVLGGRVRAERGNETARECRRRGIAAAVLGFAPCAGLELLRFCDALLRQNIRPILTEQAWQPGCSGALLLSTAISGGTLEGRLAEALDRCGEVYLDLERLRRVFPLPCRDGQGLPISPGELDRALRAGGTPFFSPELQCKVLIPPGDPVRFILYDDAETLWRKSALAAGLGIRRGFLLMPEEWSREELEEAERELRSRAG